MKQNIQGIFKKVLFGIAVLILSLGPFVTASGESGIFTGTITGTIIGGPRGTPRSDLSFGQQFARDAIDKRCIISGTGSIACQLQTSMEGVSAQNFTPQAGIQAETIAITSPYQFIGNINQRMQQLIAGGPSTNVRIANKQSSYMLRTSSTAGGSYANAYGFVGPFGISINGGGGFGNRDNAQGQTGFQLDTRQANLIVDYSFNQKLIGGFSFGYLGTDRELKLASGNLNSDSYRFAPFLLFRPTANSYLNMMGGYALVNYDSTRRVKQSGNITFEDATAKYDANQFFASLGGGYTFTFKDGWNLRGYGRGDYSHTDIEGYLESGGLARDVNNTNVSPVSWRLQANGQNIRSVTSTVGAELSHAISTRSIAAVIIPSLHAEWVHEFENDGRRTNLGYVNNVDGSLTAGTLNIAGPQRNWANLGFGLQMLFPHAIVGYVNYQRLVIKHASNNIISGGIRMNF